MNKKILVIAAHADDMEFMAGGTIAKAIDKGYTINLIIATNNEKGSYTMDKETLIAKSREEEAINAAEYLGIEPPVFLEYKDGELGDVPVNELREIFMRAIRKLRPNIVMTWDPFAPFETHPDHRQVSIAAVEAAEFANLPLFHPEHLDSGLEPHYVGEYLFFAKHPTHTNKIIDITNYIDKKIKALQFHKSQTEATIQGLLISMQGAGIDISSIIPINDVIARSGTTKQSHSNQLDSIHQILDERLTPKFQELIRKNFIVSELVIDRMLEMGLKMEASRIGAKAGFTYGEEFRYEAFGLARQIFPDAFAQKMLDL